MRESEDVEILARETCFQGYFRVDRYRLRHRLFDGRWSGEITREIFERGHAVGVLPYDPAADAVVLIEQFRVGALAAGFPNWLTEIVAGVIDEGETPEEVARREAKEEAGCEVSELIPICSYLVSPGGTSESVVLFCGRVSCAGIGGIHGLPHEDEDIKVTVVPWAEARRLLDAGEIRNAVSLIALQWLALHRDELRRRWLQPVD
ncbi:MAG: ADP-ribose diphosphatase [Alphaproteobacteria bacterium]|nr:MAG: ADP-ribose diphosphatase [Alphaproteobacteria bacterium]